MHDTIEPSDDDGAHVMTQDSDAPAPGYVGNARPTDHFFWHEEGRSMYLITCCHLHAQAVGVTSAHTLGAALIAATYANPKAKPIPWQ